MAESHPRVSESTDIDDQGQVPGQEDLTDTTTLMTPDVESNASTKQGQQHELPPKFRAERPGVIGTLTDFTCVIIPLGTLIFAIIVIRQNGKDINADYTTYINIITIVSENRSHSILNKN